MQNEVLMGLPLLQSDRFTNAWRWGLFCLFSSKSFFFNLFILIGSYWLYNIVVVWPYIDMNQPWVYMCSPSWAPLPSPSPSHPSASSLCTSPEHLVPCIKPRLVICFTYNIHFNAILSDHPTFTFSHRVQKTVLYICVSFAVSHIRLLLPSF